MYMCMVVCVCVCISVCACTNLKLYAIYCTYLFFLHIFTAVVMNRLSLEKYDVLWLSNDTIFKQKNEIASQLWSMMGEKLGKGLAYGAARYMYIVQPILYAQTFLEHVYTCTRHAHAWLYISEYNMIAYVIFFRVPNFQSCMYMYVYIYICMHVYMYVLLNHAKQVRIR